MKLQKSDLRMRPVNKTRHCADDVNNVRTTFTDQSDHIKTVAMSRTGDTNTINTISSEMHLTILPARCYGCMTRCMTRCVVSASSLGYLTTRTPDLHASYRDLKDVLSTCKHTTLAALSVSTDIRYLLTKVHMTRVQATKAAWFCLSNDRLSFC